MDDAQRAKLDARYPWERRTRRIKVSDGSMPDFDYTLAPFDETQLPPAHEIARLHYDILPTSPACKFGLRFLEDFYYTVLPQGGYIIANMAYIDETPVAFWAGTLDSNGFMDKALREHIVRLAFVVGMTVLTHPARIAAILEARRLMSARAPSNELVGESLSHGVVDIYRHHEFKSKTGLHIARDTSNMGVIELARRGATQLRSVVDQSNTRQRERVQRRGWTLVDPDAKGWAVPSVEFRIDPWKIVADE